MKAAALVVVAVVAWAMRRGLPASTARRVAALSPTTLPSAAPPSRLSPWLPRLGVLGAVIAGGTIGARQLGGAGLVAGAAAGAVGARALRQRRGRQRDGRLAAQVPEAAELMAASLQAGRSIRQALPEGAAVGPPLGPLFGHAADSLRVRPLPEVLDRLSAAAPQMAPVCAALQVSLTAGGDVARALERLATAARRRAGVTAELQSLTAQVRLSGAVMAVLPLLALALFSRVPAYQSFFRTTAGQVCLLAGLVLDLAGAVLVRRLARPGWSS